MRNADMPAMPQTDEYREHLEYYLMHDESIGEPPAEGAGLTKREYFSAFAMQAFATNVKHMVDDCPVGIRPADYIAEQSVGMADALLAELEKTS